ncbi:MULTISPECIES: tetratricopeptide repeat protein [unclassified Corallococcus]|uniref:tetratricopeptide repeat protein n=1 Tax=unclassified Corallococcus TaxID=2685029 RepID=UPI001A8CC3FD|nr:MULTISPECIES: tetratricopeptide repeat protein [unclassified Corallococcus]MBN9682923.1 tetratricopeptide repeat protein [Corallococcus sp. NCSPR001]WAS85542.1 tetratricopeptide repeat protein [Corallococcus sp. NCRR]
MARIVLITNAWGPKHGGINSFNTDLSKALGPVVAPQTRVICVVMNAASNEVEDAAKHGVKLLSLNVQDGERVDESRTLSVLAVVQAEGADEVLWWIGHDVISGAVAAALPKCSGQGKSALIHHMNYVAYSSYKHGEALAAKRKEDAQRNLFRQADEVFAVGPLLRDSLSDLLDGVRQPKMIVPGLAEIVPVQLGVKFSGITFGRFDPANDRIKQGRLAVAGFAVACREANAKPREPKSLRDEPLLRVIGVSPLSEEEKSLRIFAREKAGRVLNLLPLPYEEDRNQLFDELRRSSFAMMLSWHEGFGLTGWEAIAAEVPLIVSRNSGLYKLIDDRLGAPGLACLTVVEVRGGLGELSDFGEENFDPADEQGVSQAILNLAHDIERKKQYAKTLRTLLSERSDGYTWANCARSLADALGLSRQSEVPSSTASPDLLQATAGISAGGATEAPVAIASLVGPSILEIKEPSWDPAWGNAESQLLRAEEACVPFHESRKDLLDAVLAWAEEPDGLPAAIQFRIGSAGAGKTRLMIEACRELRIKGWSGGFLTSGAGQVSEYEIRRFVERCARVFVVVDYAETRQREVVDLIRVAFSKNRGGAERIRIMLLARDAGEWWSRLAIDYPSIESFLLGRAVTGPLRIPEVPGERQGREVIFQEALSAFAKRLGKARDGVIAPDLSAPHFANVLFIHLAAMAALSGERPETATSLLEATLRRERRYWHEAAKAQGLQPSFYQGLEQAVAILTLRAGVKDGRDARQIISSIPSLQGVGIDVVNKILGVLRTFYALSGRIDALRPDILGERLVSQELSKDGSLLDVVLDKAIDEPIQRSALVVLNRLARQSPTDVVWLQRGLSGNLSLRTAVAASAVAIESGDPIGKMLAEVLEKASSEETYDLIEPLWKKMPAATTALRECALVVARLRLERLERRLDGKPIGNEKKSKLAIAYSALAGRLSALEKHREALEVNEKALPLFKALAKLGAQHLANYALCLMHSSNALMALGQYVEALDKNQEAVSYFRSLVEANPGSYRDDLATVLHNRAAVQQRLGDFEGAYQAVKEALDVYSSMRSGGDRHQLAEYYYAFALALSHVGRTEDAMQYAQNSFAILVELADANPDAFQPKLAVTLRALASFWLDVGRYEQGRVLAEQSVVIFRGLSSARPEVFREELSASLSGLSSAFAYLGLLERALEVALESLALQKVHVGGDAGSGLMRIAIRHLKVAYAKASLGQRDDALSHVDECLGVLGELAAERPGVVRYFLVEAYALKARLFVLSGDAVLARELLRLAQPAFERLEAGRGARTMRVSRANFLVVSAQVQYLLRSYQDALGLADTATGIWDELNREHPLAHREDASEALCVLALIERELGLLGRARELAVRGLDLLQADLVRTPRRLVPWMLIAAKKLLDLVGIDADSGGYSAVWRAVRDG